LRISSAVAIFPSLQVQHLPNDTKDDGQQPEKDCGRNEFFGNIGAGEYEALH